MKHRKPLPPWERVVDYVRRTDNGVTDVELHFTIHNFRCVFHGRDASPQYRPLAEAFGTTMQEAVENCYWAWVEQVKLQQAQIAKTLEMIGRLNEPGNAGPPS